jgi:hypothetical protein
MNKEDAKMNKRIVKSYTKNELEFVYFKTKVLAIAAFIAGMMTTAVIYSVFSAIIYG